MSSTNHTTNYNLPQFVGSDKPAWLGDINPAMSAIDTAIHNAATTASQGVSDASTAQTRADSAYTLAGDANTAAGTAQTTANSAVATGNTNSAKIQALENKFNLSNINTVTTLNAGAWAVDSVKFTLAQNSDGSVFKFYGTWWSGNSTGSTLNCQKSGVAGLSGYYGIATGLYLTTAPDEAYFVEPSGVATMGVRGQALPLDQFWGATFAVGTDGQIYIYVNQGQTEGIPANNLRILALYPCIYFNSNWGDEPNA